MATTYVDQISGSGSPPVPVDPVTGAGETVAYKAPCRLATTGNITLSGLQTVDGETTVANDRVLVKAQTDETQNGIWIAQAGSWFRARDFDSNRDITRGTRVTVVDGSTLAGKEYQITTSNPIALGTDNITFDETLSSDAGSSAAAAEAARDAAIVAKDAAVSAAGTASSAASAASTSAGNAATSESNASGSAATATAAAGTATSAAGAASTSAGNAATSETNAGNAASAAVAAKDAAEAAASSIGFTIDTDGALTANSNTRVPSQAAVRTYVAAAINAILAGVAAAGDTLAELYALITSHTANTSNPHAVTAAQIGVREKLTAARNYYVRTDGSDSNNGLANTSGGAFLTIQKALDVTLGTLDLGGYNVTINVAAGTYAGAISFASAQVGAGTITINGDTTTPSNVTVGAIMVDGAGCRLFIQGLNVSKGAGSYCVKINNGAFVRTTGKNRFSSTSGGHRILLENFASAEFIAAEEIQGTVAGGHYWVQNNSLLYVQGATWTASGTAAQGWFAYVQTGAVLFAFVNTPSGTFTGARYSATLNGVIQTNGGGASYFPGNSAGSTATGGQYA